MKYIIRYYLKGDDTGFKTGYKSKKSETDLTVKEIKDFLKTELKIDETYTIVSEKLELTSHDAEITDSTILSGRTSQNLEYSIQVKKK
jgi:hypothetical protein